MTPFIKNRNYGKKCIFALIGAFFSIFGSTTWINAQTIPNTEFDLGVYEILDRAYLQNRSALSRYNHQQVEKYANELSNYHTWELLIGIKTPFVSKEFGPFDDSMQEVVGFLKKWSIGQNGNLSVSSQAGFGFSPGLYEATKQFVIFGLSLRFGEGAIWGLGFGLKTLGTLDVVTYNQGQSILRANFSGFFDFSKIGINGDLSFLLPRIDLDLSLGDQIVKGWAWSTQLDMDIIALTTSFGKDETLGIFFGSESLTDKFWYLLIEHKWENNFDLGHDLSFHLNIPPLIIDLQNGVGTAMEGQKKYGMIYIGPKLRYQNPITKLYASGYEWQMGLGLNVLSNMFDYQGRSNEILIGTTAFDMFLGIGYPNYRDSVSLVASIDFRMAIKD